MTPKELHAAALASVRHVLVESDATFELLLAALVVGGNVLIEGMPGTAKTLMARALAQLLDGPGETEAVARGAVLDAGQQTTAQTPTQRAPAMAPAGARFQRIQFTPDLMPSDIVGTNVFNMQTSSFSLRPGPIFANIVVADEINRAPAKTQSALLEAMEERQVTIEGHRLTLPPVFMVVATQNPVEFEGTYPLPEAQLDRFLFKLAIEYASAAAERDIVLLHHRGFRITDLEEAGLQPVVDERGLLEVRAQVGAVTVDTTVADYIVRVQRETRTAPEVQYGASVRGGIGMLNGSKAIAAFAGRDYVTPDDVKAVAAPVLRHRIVLKPEAELDGVRPDDVISRILAHVPVPR